MDPIDVESSPPGWPPSDGGKRVLKGGGGPPPIVIIGGLLVVLILAVIALGATGRVGATQINDDQVGVLVDYMSGEKEVLTGPGFHIYMPVIQEVFLFDKSSQEFVMEGDRFVNDNHVPRLTVRANDGSNFWFEELTILFEIIPERADKLLEDSGPGVGFKRNWIKAFARSILRDEFGRFSSVEAADPSQYRVTTDASRDRLNALLVDHGLRVTRIITPKPKFDSKYEKAIEDRKEADQDVERLIAFLDQLEQERRQRLSAVEKEKEIEMQELTGELTRELLNAERQAINITQAAAAYAIARRKTGEGELAHLVAQARGLEAKYTKAAEGLVAQALALEERGEVVVREALIEKLSRIKFTFLPYSRDPAPKRLEHSGSSSGNSTRLDESSFEEDR